MNALLEELKQHEGAMKALEEQANEHEAAARKCRAKRMEAKQRIAELNAQINDAKVVHAVQGSLAAAEAARQDAEKAKAESATVLESLKAKESKLDELLAKLEAAPPAEKSPEAPAA